MEKLRAWLRTTWGTFVAGITVVGAIGSVFALGYLLGTDDSRSNDVGLTTEETRNDEPEVQPTPTSTTTAAPTSTTTSASTTEPEPSTTTTTTTTTLAPRTAALTSSDSADEDDMVLRNFAGDADGVTYTQGLSLYPGYGPCTLTGWIEFNLGRDWSRFMASVALSDESRTEAVMRVTLMVDGSTSETIDVSFGQTIDVDVDIEEALRLRVQIDILRPENCRQTDRLVFGNPQLVDG